MDGMIVQHLTNYICVGIDSILNESHITHIARVFYALKTSLEKLSTYYKSQQPTSDHLVSSCYFPSITAYPQGNVLIEFKYLGYLENSPDCVTLHAQTIASRQDIVVKFVNRYGERAHWILVDESLALKLLYCRSPHLNDSELSYQSISMVVMEYVDGNKFAVAKQKLSEESVEAVQLAVQHALELLHSHGLVFGDLCWPNAMITKDDNVKLIDFSWAGEDGQAKYPSLISVDITWPEGVEALAVMRKQHDLAMLSRF